MNISENSFDLQKDRPELQIFQSLSPEKKNILDNVLLINYDENNETFSENSNIIKEVTNNINNNKYYLIIITTQHSSSFSSNHFQHILGETILKKTKFKLLSKITSSKNNSNVRTRIYYNPTDVYINFDDRNLHKKNSSIIPGKISSLFKIRKNPNEFNGVNGYNSNNNSIKSKNKMILVKDIDDKKRLLNQYKLIINSYKMESFDIDSEGNKIITIILTFQSSDEQEFKLIILNFNINYINITKEYPEKTASFKINKEINFAKEKKIKILKNIKNQKKEKELKLYLNGIVNNTIYNILGKTINISNMNRLNILLNSSIYYTFPKYSDNSDKGYKTIIESKGKIIIKDLDNETILKNISNPLSIKYKIRNLQKTTKEINIKHKTINNEIKNHEHLINNELKKKKSLTNLLFGTSQKTIQKEKELIEKLKSECVEVCDKYNKYYKISYINLDKFKEFKMNVEIIDLLTNDHFPYFLESLNEYSIKTKKELNNYKNSKLCDSICYKKKLLFLFIIDNYITDNLINIFFKIYYVFRDSINGKKTISIKNGKKYEYILFTKENDKIIVDFEAIGKFLKYELDPLREFKNNSKNKKDDIKKYFIVSIIMFLFNYLFDEHKQFNKLLRNNYDDFNQNLNFLNYIDTKESIKISFFTKFKNELKKDILKREEFKNYSDIINIDYVTIIINIMSDILGISYITKLITKLMTKTM